MPKKNKGKAIPKKQARSIAREVAKDISSQKKNARFNLKLDSVAAGPFALKGLSLRNSRMAGLADPARNIQVVMPRISSTVRQSDGAVVDVLEGTDLVASVSTSGADAGDVLVEAYINPSALIGTRLAQFAPLYQRYRFVDIEFMYQPIAPATDSGQVIGFCTFDPDSPFPSSDSLNLNKAAAFFGNRQNQIWEPASYGQHQLNSMTDLYIDTGSSDVRFSYQGIFYLLAASNITANTLGQIYCRYKVELMVPQLQPGLGAPASARATITGSSVVAGAVNLFGTSITQIEGSTLTLERLASNVVQVLGCTPGSILVFTAAVDYGGNGGALGGTSGTLVTAGLTSVSAAPAYVVYNANNATACVVFTAEVTLSNPSIQWDATSGAFASTGTADATLCVTQFPQSPTALLKRRKLRQAQMAQLCDLLSPMLSKEQIQAHQLDRLIALGQEAEKIPNSLPVADPLRAKREMFLREAAIADQEDRYRAPGRRPVSGEFTRI